MEEQRVARLPEDKAQVAAATAFHERSDTPKTDARVKMGASVLLASSRRRCKYVGFARFWNAP
jgi:hypothetical protein